jgi:hypothetical protein
MEYHDKTLPAVTTGYNIGDLLRSNRVFVEKPNYYYGRPGRSLILAKHYFSDR